MKPDAPQRAQQHISHRGEPQPQLIGPHRGGRGAIGIKIELALLDAVLHVAAAAIDLLVEISRLALGAPERGDHEAGIGLVLGPLRLRHHAPPLAPAVARLPGEVLEQPRRLAGAPALRRSPIELAPDLGDEPIVLGKPNTKCTPFASHHAINSSRANPLSARTTMRTRGQRLRMWATMRATSSTEPAEASMSARRSLAANKSRPQNT